MVSWWAGRGDAGRDGSAVLFSAEGRPSERYGERLDQPMRPSQLLSTALDCFHRTPSIQHRCALSRIRVYTGYSVMTSAYQGAAPRLRLRCVSVHAAAMPLSWLRRVLDLWCKPHQQPRRTPKPPLNAAIDA